MTKDSYLKISLIVGDGISLHLSLHHFVLVNPETIVTETFVALGVHDDRTIGKSAHHLHGTFVVRIKELVVVLDVGIEMVMLVPVAVGRGKAEQTGSCETDNVTRECARVVQVEKGLVDSGRLVLIDGLRKRFVHMSEIIF